MFNKLLIILLLTLLISGCTTPGMYNPNSLPESKIAYVNNKMQYPCNFQIVAVDGKTTEGLDNPFKSPVFEKISEGAHDIRWIQYLLGDIYKTGDLRITLEGGKRYAIGIKDRKNSDEVSVWNTETGEIISNDL